MPHAFPLQEEGFRKERIYRCSALLGLEDTIAGIPVLPLTPELLDLLIVRESPFVCGGMPTNADTVALLSIIAPSLELNSVERVALWYAENMLTLDWEKSALEIRDYFDRAFMDEPQGGPQTPYYPLSVSFAYQMAEKPYEWDVERTRGTPIPVIFQYLRAVANAKKYPIQNKISDAGAGAGLLEIQKLIDEGKWTREMQDKINGVLPSKSEGTLAKEAAPFPIQVVSVPAVKKPVKKRRKNGS